MPIAPDMNAFHAAERAYERGKAESAAEVKRLREALELVKGDMENCDWSCPRCHHEYEMTETDMYLWTRDALNPPPKPANINEDR